MEDIADDIAGEIAGEIVRDMEGFDMEREEWPVQDVQTGILEPVVGYFKWIWLSATGFTQLEQALKVASAFLR